MSIRTEISLNGCELTVFIAGSFDLEAAKEFRNAYRVHRGCESFVLDFAEPLAMTSAGLANLVVMYQWAGSEAARISIIHANAHVIESLHFAGFERLFEIETT